MNEMRYKVEKLEYWASKNHIPKKTKKSNVCLSLQKWATNIVRNECKAHIGVLFLFVSLSMFVAVISFATAVSNEQ